MFKTIFSKKIKYYFLILLVAVTITLPAVSHAQLSTLKNIGGAAYGTETPESPAATAGRVINIGLSLVGIIFLILMIYGGYVWMTARGKEERLNKAKETIEASIIGLIIVLAAYGITYFIISRIIASTTGVTTTPPPT